MAHRDSHWTVATSITDAMAKADSRSSSPVNSGNERPAAVMAATVEICDGAEQGRDDQAAGVVALDNSLNDGF